MSTVLLVEDTEALTDLYARWLTNTGFRVTVAQNGAEAVEIALKQRPEAIVMDFALPEKSGLEAAQEIRSNAETSTIPIIMMTAIDKTALSEERLRALSSFNDLLWKPFDIMELPRRLRMLVKLKIAVVDDEEMLLKLMSRQLDPFGSVTRSQGCEEAWAFLQRESVDLVVTDLDTKESIFNGITLLALVRTLPTPPRVILASGKTDEKLRMVGKKLGAHAVLVKPDQILELPTLVGTSFGFPLPAPKAQ